MLRFSLRLYAHRFLRHQRIISKFISLSNQTSPERKFLLLSFLPAISTLHALEFTAKRKCVNFSKVDQYFEENKFEEIRQELLPHKETEDAEILWRLARAYYKLSKTAANEKERQELIKEGALYAEKAVELGPDLPVVHVWYCVLIDARSKFEGFESRIATVLKARQHLMRAVELDPMDVTALHMLALWCYEASVVPWYQRKIASAFATLPTSSYEESLEFCRRAQKAYSPKCFSPNLLLMGKIYDKLGEREVAVELLKRAKNCPGHTEREQNANIEAAATLENWGIKL